MAARTAALELAAMAETRQPSSSMALMTPIYA